MKKPKGKNYNFKWSSAEKIPTFICYGAFMQYSAEKKKRSGIINK